MARKRKEPPEFDSLQAGQAWAELENAAHDLRAIGEKDLAKQVDAIRNELAKRRGDTE